MKIVNELETNYLYKPVKDYLGKPKKHMCFEHEIMEFVLDGHQTLGRPADKIPDIPVTNRYVSRNHGYFDTTDYKVTYTAEDTLNGTIFRRQLLKPGETVELWDGDELIIPVSEQSGGVDVMLVCAIIESRINIWRDLELASRDALTGLSGRNAFRTWYIQNYSWKREENLSLFILDIDNFKRINDVYGHASGDSALKILSEELRLVVGGKGYVCRWGGDEFVGVIDDNAGGALLRLENLRKKLRELRIDDSFCISISAGVVDADKGKEADALIMLADKALYKAKEAGRDCVFAYNG